MKQISSNQKYYEIILLRSFTVALFIVCQMKQCIVLKVLCFYLRGSKGPSVLLSTRDEKFAIIYHEIVRLNIGNQYKKNAT